MTSYSVLQLQQPLSLPSVPRLHQTRASLISPDRWHSGYWAATPQSPSLSKKIQKHRPLLPILTNFMANNKHLAFQVHHVLVLGTCLLLLSFFFDYYCHQLAVWSQGTERNEDSEINADKFGLGAAAAAQYPSCTARLLFDTQGGRHLTNMRHKRKTSDV